MTTNPQILIETTKATAEDRKVEVSVRGDKAVIQMLTYADGIGWFVQKTITVDVDMLDAMSDQFAIARGRIQREGDDILSADMLEY